MSQSLILYSINYILVVILYCCSSYLPTLQTVMFIDQLATKLKLGSKWWCQLNYKKKANLFHKMKYNLSGAVSPPSRIAFSCIGCENLLCVVLE